MPSEIYPSISLSAQLHGLRDDNKLLVIADWGLFGFSSRQKNSYRRSQSLHDLQFVDRRRPLSLPGAAFFVWIYFVPPDALTPAIAQIVL